MAAAAVAATATADTTVDVIKLEEGRLKLPATFKLCGGSRNPAAENTTAAAVMQLAA